MAEPLRIVVCVKHVPDTSADRRFNDDGTTDRESVDCRLSELDEYAIEQALQVVESGVEAEITYLTMGPEGAAATLRKALSMGGDKAIHVSDEALHGSDYAATARVLAAAARKAGFDLILCGMASTDAVASVVPAMLAEVLGVPQVTYAAELQVADGTARIRRDGDTATVRVEAALPAVVSVTDQTGEARYPSFKGIMAAKKKPVETWTLADLDVDPSAVGLGAARTRVDSVEARPAREAGTIVTDGGDGSEGATGLVEFLAAKKFV
jgi:electron transfer flavoprotein beta subunit